MPDGPYSRQPSPRQIEQLLAAAWWALERWDVYAARADAERACAAAQEGRLPTLEARARVLISRVDLMASALPRTVELPEGLAALRGDRDVEAAVRRFEAERLLACAAERSSRVSDRPLSEESTPDEVAASVLEVLARDSVRPPLLSGVERIDGHDDPFGWNNLALALDAESRGTASQGLLARASSAAESSGSLAALWAVLASRARIGARRRAFREERMARVSMAELLERWLLSLSSKDAETASSRPDRRAYSGRDLMPVAEGGRLLQLSLEMSDEHDVEGLLRLALDACLAETGAQRGAVLLGSGPGDLCPMAVHLVDRGRISQLLRISDLRERVLCRGEVWRSEAPVAASHSARPVDVEGLALCAPVRARRENMGMIYLELSNGRHFGEAASAAVQITGTLLGAAVLRAETLARLRGENVEGPQHSSRLQTAPEVGKDARECSGPAEALGLGSPRLVGHGAAMTRLKRDVERVARSAAPVLILGESGTGKELVARAIHATSSNRTGPFLVADCGCLDPERLEVELLGIERGLRTPPARGRPGLFEVCKGGSLLLDEVGRLPPTLQKALLRVLEAAEVQRLGGTRPRTVTVRILAASATSLADLTVKGCFLQELRERLEVVKVTVPPLRERLEDLPELAEHLLAAFHAQHGLPERRLSSAALAALARRKWAGNVRELGNLLASACVSASGRRIEPQDLRIPSRSDVPPRWRQRRRTSAREPDHSARIEAIRGALLATSGHRGRAAKLLGISRATFYRYLDQYGIDPKSGHVPR